MNGAAGESVRERTELAAGVCAALEADVAGSRAGLIGSLGKRNPAARPDFFSDIDVEWVVPDDRFAVAVAGVRGTLEGVRPVRRIRDDPDFLHARWRRLLFVTFAGVPLFWRLDLSVRAARVAGDPDDAAGDPAAWAREGEWSRPASALANAVGAVKAVARHRPDQARGLLDRGFARIGEADRATGRWPEDVARLARAAARLEPGLAAQAREAVHLAATYATT